MKCIRISALAVLFLAVLFTAGTVAAAQQGQQQRSAGIQQQWYDPGDWFEKGGTLSFETDWFNNTYGYYDQSGFERFYGYYGGEPFEMGPSYDYYSDGWHADRDVFDF